MKMDSLSQLDRDLEMMLSSEFSEDRIIIQNPEADYAIKGIFDDSAVQKNQESHMETMTSQPRFMTTQDNRMLIKEESTFLIRDEEYGLVRVEPDTNGPLVVRVSK